jgi:hypothetical protein
LKSAEGRRIIKQSPRRHLQSSIVEKVVVAKTVFHRRARTKTGAFQKMKNLMFSLPTHPQHSEFLPIMTGWRFIF